MTEDATRRSNPCYFCGNEYMAFWDYSTEYSLDKTVSVFCPLCGARGPKKASKEQARESWNNKPETNHNMEE